MNSPVSVLVYGDVNMNIIDGSSVWTQSVCLALAQTQRVDVSLLLKTAPENDRLLGPLYHPRVKVIDPVAERLVPEDSKVLTPETAADVVEEQLTWDRILVRGSAAANALASRPAIAGRLWTYLTDVPQNALDVTVFIEDEMEVIGNSSEVVFSQTEELRSFLESTFPSVNGKCRLLPPMIPDGVEPNLSDPPTRDELRMVYSGKLAPAWNTLEMCRLPSDLEAHGISSELTVVGDKFNKDPGDPGYVARMRHALEKSAGVRWAGGMSREESLAEMSRAHVGLSWRAESMSDSLELSTKLLEYCAVGTPPIVNRTPMHEALLGEDYPLFANSEDEVIESLGRVASDQRLYATMLETTHRVADTYTISEAARQLDAVVDSTIPSPLNRSGKTKVLVMSHDLKFFEPLQSYLAAMPDVDLAVDRWTALDRHDPLTSLELMADADTIICEWCGPNAAFASQNKKPEQKLIVRLHRFELYSGYWRFVDISAVDTVVTVSPHYRDLTVELTGWPRHKVISIPNYVDCDQLDRKKMQGARFHVGMIGVAPSRKRLDLALDVMRELRANDPRFILFVKSKLPWDYPWIWDEGPEKEYYAKTFRTLQDPALQEGVVFDSFGSDVPSWLRKIGFVISTSDDESFHLAPAEGMASRAVPVIRDWPGSETIYSNRWISDIGSMADRIASLGLDEDRWEEEGAVAAAEVRSNYDIGLVRQMWRGLLTKP